MAVATAIAQAAAGPVFPTVSFDNLRSARVTLPADLHQDRNLLVLYFKLDQQPDVNGWNTVIDQWRSSGATLGSSYTCLVSPRSNIISRWFLNSSLRSDNPDQSRWDTMLPLYVDKRQFLATLSIASEKQVVVLVTDRQGHVLARAAGPPTEQSRAALRSVLTPQP